MKYNFTHLEDWIKKFYNGLGIFHPHQLDFQDIADRIGIEVHLENISSRCIGEDIIIDKRLSPQEQWQDFSHEFGHALRHEGNQLFMSQSFLELQENQANTFMYHFCVPTFMLLNNEITNYFNINNGISYVAEKFKVTEPFAKERLIQFRNKIAQAKSDEQHRKYMESLYPKAPPYSAETNAILKKLYMQLERKGVEV